MGNGVFDNYKRCIHQRNALHDAALEFLAAEDAVQAEAARAEKNGGQGWSIAPTVRRLYAVKALREAAQLRQSSPEKQS